MASHLNNNPVKPSRVVLIGAYGFLGRKLIDHLNSQQIEYLPIDLPEVDLTAPTSVEKFLEVIKPEDSVIFTSALTPDKGKDRGAMLKNIAMMNHFCQFLENGRCSYIVYLSTDAVYGAENRLLRETSPCLPDSLYGFGHLIREEMLRPVAKQREIPLVVLRSNAMYGVGDTHNGYGPNRFLRSALQERKISLFGKGEERRCHIYVGDVVNLIGLCLAKKTEGVLNLTSGASISFMDLAGKISALVDNEIDIQTSRRQNPITHINFDPTEIYKAFPNFWFTSLDDGLKSMIANGFFQ
ncbi:MAG: NAD-dependent epimerase/dehydratase family protein [Anaerolineales bacterium]|jgi:UDP-glucose 4-epimerase|nr:NAD-dependent epimerase/dehydratase family protein [Anaerolineales bacterium]